MAVLLRGKLKASHLSEAAVVFGFLTQNTDSEVGRRLILELLKRPKLPDLALQNTIYAATHAEVRDAIPVMRRLLREGCTHALDFVGRLHLEECVEDVVAYMKHPKGSVLLGIFALQKIGSPQVVPYLMHYATREFTSRKKDEREWRYYSILALNKIGDTSALQQLAKLLAQFKDWEAPQLLGQDKNDEGPG
jgi:HEAT repeat protein